MNQKILLNLPVTLKANQINFHWDSFDPYKQLGELNNMTEFSIRNMSLRARIAYAISCLEWVVFYLSDLYEKDDLRPYHYVNSFWKTLNDYDPNCKLELDTPTPTEENEWQGPVLASTDLSIVTVINAFYSILDITNNNQGIVDACFAELIPLFILDSKIQKHFISWKEDVLNRLEQSFPFHKENPWGDSISREFMYKYINLNRFL